VWWVEQAVECKEFTLGICLDIEGAFDKDTFESIEMAKEEARLDLFIQIWNTHILRNRRITVEPKGIKNRRLFTKNSHMQLKEILRWPFVVIEASNMTHSIGN
jgi:hypothetical protein